MQDNYTTKGKHLTRDDRKNIERWHKEGKSNRMIAKLLGKSPQTIHNEIKRGKVAQRKNNKYIKAYYADYADEKYKQNRKKSVKPIRLLKEEKRKIEHYIKQKYSPEMIVKTKGVSVSISTIYYWINNGHLDVTRNDMIYPRKQKSIKKQASPNFKQAGKSIDERPEHINNRLEYGHYEIDTVILSKEKNPCLLTLTDRLSRHQLIRLIPDKSSYSVNHALKSILKSYSILSLTADNGTEFSRISDVFPSDCIYYAHPYSSWERGTNENHNRLIRRWLPKGTTKTTTRMVAFIENWINHYPKKLFNYKSPFFIFSLANLHL